MAWYRIPRLGERSGVGARPRPQEKADGDSAPRADLSRPHEHIAPGDLAERAERWGFHTLWVTDHALTPRLDPLVLLAAMSQRTRRLCLGTGVLAVPYRSPYLTAKAWRPWTCSQGGASHSAWASAISSTSLKRLSSTVACAAGSLTSGWRSSDACSPRSASPLPDAFTASPTCGCCRAPCSSRTSRCGWADTGTAASLRPCCTASPASPTSSFRPGPRSRATGREAQAAIRRHAEAQGRAPDTIGWGVQIWTYAGDSTAQGRRTGTRAMQERFGLAQVDLEQSTAMGSAADCIATLEHYSALGITEFNLSAVCPVPEMAEQYGRIAEEILPHFAR